MADFAKSKVCIYTAIYGGYERLLAQPEQTIDCDFVCFTDNQSLTCPGWKVIYSNDDPSLGPRLQAQFPKLMPHEIFESTNLTKEHSQGLPPYDFTIWMDANAVIKNKTVAQEMLSYIGKYGIAMFTHPDRDCIYDEVEFCLNIARYQDTLLSEQVSQYVAEGYPEHNGLFACGFIARDMRRQEVQKLNEWWWHENRRWSTSDQVCLAYILWKKNYGCDVIRHDLWNNHLFRLHPHHQVSLHLMKKYGVSVQSPRPPEGKCEGYVEAVDCTMVSGWVWDPRQPDIPVLVHVYDGETRLDTTVANRFREDLITAGKGNGAHGFISYFPDSLRDGKPHEIWVGVSPTDDSLNRQRPTIITCGSEW